jgi:hypothetical protein
MVRIEALSHQQKASLYIDTTPQLNLAFTGLHKTFSSVTKSLLKSYGFKYKHEVNIIVHNIATALKVGKGTVLLPRKQSTYLAANKANSKNKTSREAKPISYTKMIKLTGKMEEDGLIEIFVGGLIGNKKILSRISVTDKLLTLFKENKTKVQYAPKLKTRDHIILKDDKGFEIKPPRGAKLKYGKDVKDIVNFMKGFDIRWRGEKLNIKVYRMFKLDKGCEPSLLTMENYGRWNFPEQNIKSELRKEITIDGELTVEWDYSSQHANLCYSLANLPCKGESFKPYAIEDFSLVEAPKDGDVRKIYKLGMMCLLNTKGAAHQALKNAWKKYSNDTTPTKKRGELYGYKGIENCSDIIRGLKERNIDILHIVKDINAGKLQFLDSQIALEVMLEMKEKGICVIPYHDSFMVADSYSQDLQDAMYNAWLKVMGNNQHCYIDKK